MLSSVTSSVWWKVFLGAIQLDFSDCRRGRVWKSQTQLRFFCNVPTTVVTVCVVIEATMIQRFSDLGSLSESLTNDWMLGRLDIQMGRYDEINLHCMIDRTLADLKVNFFIHVNTSSNRVFSLSFGRWRHCDNKIMNWKPRDEKSGLINFENLVDLYVKIESVYKPDYYATATTTWLVWSSSNSGQLTN